MKKLITLLFLINILFLNAQTGLLNGTGYAPNFTVTDLNGNSHELYNYLDSGYVTVLEFLSVTCGHCVMHAPGTENSYLTNGPSGNNSARFLGLEVNGSTDSAAVANFANTHNVTFPIANDVTPYLINYQMSYTPTYYVVYPDRSYTTICANCITPTSASTIEGLLDNAIASWPPIYGCTDLTAVNYDSAATIDDGSCDLTSYTIKTLGMTFSPDTVICDVGDTIHFILGQSHNAVEVDYSTFVSGGNTSNGGFSFGYGAAGMYIPTNAQTYYYVCQPHSSSGMVGVIIANSYGCTDPTALNYDSLANVDDGGCDYSSYTIETIGMTFSPDTIVCDVGDTINFILGNGHNAVEVTDSTWLAGGNAPIAGGFSFGYGATGMYIPDDCHTFYYVCSPHAAYGMKGVIIAHHPPIQGCTDTLANNYDSTATIDDGSCLYPDITITYPFEDDEITTTNNVNVDFTVSNFTIGLPASGGDGHIHYYVNGVMTPHFDITSILLPNLANGGYEVILTLFDNNHQPIYPIIADTVIFSVNVIYGCTGPTYCNYDPNATVDDGSCWGWAGCTDSMASNYNSMANCDDGSCTYPSVCNEDAPTGLFVDGIIHSRAVINWDNMNSSTCTVDQYRIRYRVAGTSGWTNKTMGGPLGSCTWGNQRIDKLLLGLTGATTYEYQMKAWYCGGGASSWTSLHNFTTADNCPNVGNLAAYGTTTTKATFTWDDSNGPYEFVRLKSRVDSISNASGSDWFQIGGAGVSYGTYTKDKNGLVPGETYRGQARSYCDPNGGAWKSVTWTSLVYWTQPVVRVEGGTAIANLAIYPNPSRDVFNITFRSEAVQDLKVRVLNVVGEVIISEDLDQFIGEYTKQINLHENAKGIYFLEIETNDGVVNKKLILQ
jgi:plastocyanin